MWICLMLYRRWFLLKRSDIQLFGCTSVWERSIPSDFECMRRKMMDSENRLIINAKTTKEVRPSLSRSVNGFLISVIFLTRAGRTFESKCRAVWRSIKEKISALGQRIDYLFDWKLIITSVHNLLNDQKRLMIILCRRRRSLASWGQMFDVRTNLWSNEQPNRFEQKVHILNSSNWYPFRSSDLIDRENWSSSRTIFLLWCAAFGRSDRQSYRRRPSFCFVRESSPKRSFADDVNDSFSYAQCLFILLLPDIFVSSSCNATKEDEQRFEGSRHGHRRSWPSIDHKLSSE